MVVESQIYNKIRMSGEGEKTESGGGLRNRNAATSSGGAAPSSAAAAAAADGGNGQVLPEGVADPYGDGSKPGLPPGFASSVSSKIPPVIRELFEQRKQEILKADPHAFDAGWTSTFDLPCR